MTISRTDRAPHIAGRRLSGTGAKSKPKCVRRAIAGLAVAGSLAAAGGVLLPATANAATGDVTDSWNLPAPGQVRGGDTGVAMGQQYDGGGFPMNLTSYWTPDPANPGQYVRTICVQMGVPANNTGAFSEGGTDESAPAAQLAWMLTQHLGQSPAGDSALQDWSHVNYEHATDPYLAALNASPGGQAALAQGNAWAAEAAAFTGGYGFKPAISATGTGTGKVTNTQMLTRTGSVSVPVTLTLSGPAVFDATGTDTIQVNAGDTPAFHDTVGGTPSIGVHEATVGKYPLGLRLLKGAGIQTQALASEPVTIAGDTAAVVPNQVKLAISSTAPDYVKPGEKLTDIVHVSVADGAAWPKDASGQPVPAVIDDTWYQNATDVAAASAVPAGLAPYATGSVTVTGPGDYVVTGDKTAGPGGHYLPVVQFSKAAQGQNADYFAADFQAGINDPGEHSIVRFSPKYTTKTSELTPDGRLKDQITPTGAAPDQVQTAKAVAYISYDTAACSALTDAGQPQAPADAQTVGTVTVDIKGNTAAWTPEIQLDASENADVHSGKACVWWVDSADQTAMNDAVALSNHLIAAETVYFSQPTPAVAPTQPPAVEAPTAVVPAAIDAPAVKMNPGSIGQASSDGDISPVLWPTLGGAGLVLAALGAYLLRRRAKAAAAAESAE